MASSRAARPQPTPSQESGGPRLQRKFFNLATGFDMHFFVLLMIILIVGLATLYSASHVYAFNYNDGDSFFFIRKQAVFAGLGLVAMLGISMVDYHVLHRFALPIWLVSLGLLVAAYLMPSETGIRRWVQIGPISFQPSEIAKFALVLLLAHYVSLNYKKMKKFTVGFVIPIIAVAITCGLVVIEPHLSGTLLSGI